MTTDQEYEEQEQRLENACVAALDQRGVRLHLDEAVEIALAKKILADYASRGERMPVHRVRDRLSALT